MADNENQTPEQAPQSENAPQFAIQRIYLKDASLEMPNAPEILLAPDAPQVDIQLEVSEAPLSQPDLYEVVVRATVTATTKINNEDKTVFLVEGKQAGIFLLKDFPAEQRQMILGIACPSTIYPYLRSNICDLLTRAGMPPVYLGEINFEAYYAQRMQEMQQQQQQQEQQAETTTKQ